MNGGIIEVAAAVIRRGNKVLLASRPEDKPPAGWEFPGGKIEAGETPGEALTREIWEELGVEATPGTELGTLLNGRIKLHFIAATIPDAATPAPRENQQFFWVELTPDAPEKLLPAYHEFWKRLAKTDNFF